MRQEEVFFHWNYFCSLCERLSQTKNYVDHSNFSIEGKVFKNESVFSNEFQQILILSSIEFENTAKLLAKSIDPNFDIEGNIKDITSTILSRYPLIKETKVTTNYKSAWMPLHNWSINNTRNNNDKKVTGLTWWKDYNCLKHKGFDNFYKATLQNAIESLASLYVLELYLMFKELDNLQMAIDNPCCYFNSEYISSFLSVGGKILPDFENRNNG